MEVVIAFKECIQAIPDALLPPSPGPIIDCLKALFKVFALLLKYIPPFNYLQTLVDLMDYVIAIVDEVSALFVLLDDKITEQLQIAADALTLGDLELVAISDCVTGEANVLVVNAMDILKFITPLIKTMLEPLARLMPEPTLRQKLTELANIPAQLEALQATIEETTGPPVLSPLLETMFILRDIAVIVANVIAPLAGGSANRQPVDPPVLVNL